MYEGGEMPRNKKNLAFHIVYQSDERTLTDKEVDKIHNRIVREVSKRMGWEVRK
jgi:phenylalanyl-tRNA synthetase beta chain